MNNIIIFKLTSFPFTGIIIQILKSLILNVDFDNLQLARKRHIGNDMVTVIFQESDALPFSPITVRSHFQHVFIIVRVSNPCTDDVTYRFN